MRFSICLILLGLQTAAIAQDDIPDFRNKRESFTKVYEKDIRTDLAAFTYGGIDEGVGKQALRSIPAVGFKGNTMRFKGDNTEVIYETGTFTVGKHKMYFVENTHLQKIDNKAFYGDYGSVPKTTITSITVIVGADTIRVPPAAFADIYNPHFTYMDKGVEKTNSAVYFSPDKRKIYVYFLNKGVSDKYEVTWVIQDGKYFKRVIDYNVLP